MKYGNTYVLLHFYTMTILKTFAYSLLVCTALIGCNNIDNIAKPEPKPDGYRVSGTVSNNVGSGLTLKNADESITVTGGSFAFSIQEDGSSYLVSIAIHPIGQLCGIANGGGQISGASIANVEVTCTSLPLNFTANISLKQLNFTWDAIPGITHYKILENPNGFSGFTPLKNSGDITKNSYSHILAAHLFDQANARYRLEAYESQLGTTTLVNFSADLTISDALNNAIGSLTSVPGNSSLSQSANGLTLAVGAPFDGSTATGIGGNPANDCNVPTAGRINCAVYSGAVYVYTRNSSGSWRANPSYIKAPYADAEDEFGFSISLSADGNTLAVGAHREDSAATGIGGNPIHDCNFPAIDQTNCARWSGAVYVYTRDTSGSWGANPVYIKASNTEPGDVFGNSVSLSADGNTLVVGAQYEDSGATGIDGNLNDNSGNNSGAVYVYARDASGLWGGNPTYIKASNTDQSDNFGYSIGLDSDGNTLAVGSFYEDSAATGIGGNQMDDCESATPTNCAVNSGAVYVYTRDLAGSWNANVSYIKASNSKRVDWFGISIGLSADGNTLAVGAGNEQGGATGIDGNQVNDCNLPIVERISCSKGSGAVYVYSRDSSGAWGANPTYIKASNTDLDEQTKDFSTIYGDRFGTSISLSANGNTLVVEAPDEDSAAMGIGGIQVDDCELPVAQQKNCSLNSGAVYVYTRDSSGAWGANPTYIKAHPDDLTNMFYFGSSASLSADGYTLYVKRGNIVYLY